MVENKFMKDYSFGKTKEIEILPLIQNEFDSTIKCSKNMYAVCDFEGDSCNIELKSRRCSLHSYQDTMITKAKIDYLLNQNKKGYCVFSFFDGLVYIPITLETVATFRRSIGGRKDRGKLEMNDYYYIPCDSLKRFVKTPFKNLT